MGVRSILAPPLAAWVAGRYRASAADPEATQRRVLAGLSARAAGTTFGREHGLAAGLTPEAFARQVPVRDYEGLRPWIERITHHPSGKAERDVLWPGLPTYWAKTSGTTSGVKYIPLTRESVPSHIAGARDALLHYVHATGRARFLDRRMIFLSGSPVLSKTLEVPTGRLSGIVNHHVPAYLRGNQLPSYETNCIEDWEAKLDRVADETLGADMSVISGIPPWVQMYFDRVQARTGKTIREVWPQFELFVYGGVAYGPYRRRLEQSMGGSVPSIELFPASEGFFAFQDRPDAPGGGMLLRLDAGMYYEFIPADKAHESDPPRLTVGQVEVGKPYALIITSNAGLWAYSIGDLVQFTSLAPPRLVVAGRVSHFLSAFGEHVIGQEVEKALDETLARFADTSVSEFTVAPQVTPDEGLPHHEWLIEFGRPPANLPAFERALDEAMQRRNIYYRDLLEGRILETLHVTLLPAGAFNRYMAGQGKLGGQNKVPRLSNDRRLADGLLSAAYKPA